MSSINYSGKKVIQGAVLSKKAGLSGTLNPVLLY
jgi:hypothetical protein